jgi:hypothetical protein
MGGAFTAIANDENSVWTNPAGIARIRKPRTRRAINLVKIPGIVMGANTKSQEYIQGVSGSGNADNVDQLVDQANELDNKPFWSVFGMFPMMMYDLGSMPSVLGAYTHTTLKSVIDSQSPDLARTEAISDVGGVFSLAYANRTNRFNVGVNFRYLGRYAYEDNVPITTFKNPKELQARIKSGSNKTTALAIDAGMMFTFADFWYPTFGLAVLNAPTGCQNNYLNPFSKVREKVCGTRFYGDITNPDALSTIDPTDIRAGFSITPRFSRKFAARIALDWHHIHLQSGSRNYGFQDIPIQKQLHAGVEFFLGNPLTPSPLSFSMGLSQGFYTVGASLRLGFLAIDFTSFGRDISSDDTPQEDRRVMGSLSVDL